MVQLIGAIPATCGPSYRPYRSFHQHPRHPRGRRTGDPGGVVGFRVARGTPLLSDRLLARYRSTYRCQLTCAQEPPLVRTVRPDASRCGFPSDAGRGNRPFSGRQRPAGRIIRAGAWSTGRDLHFHQLFPSFHRDGQAILKERFDVNLNGLLDVLDHVSFCAPLGDAPGEGGHRGHVPTFVTVLDQNAVCHLANSPAYARVNDSPSSASIFYSGPSRLAGLSAPRKPVPAIIRTGALLTYKADMAPRTPVCFIIHADEHYCHREPLG